jgi:hypothetical protein
MRISQRHIKEIFKARYVSFDLRKISALTITSDHKSDGLLIFYNFYFI